MTYHTKIILDESGVGRVRLGGMAVSIGRRLHRLPAGPRGRAG
jgi:hypothetical protein